jgi:hypothetical protein
VSGQAGSAGLDAGMAVEAAATAVQVAIRTAALAGCVVPEWAGTVAGLLEDWCQQLGPGGWSAGQAGTARTPGVLDAPWRLGVLAGSCVPAAPLTTHPLLMWLWLRFGLRRCLACGRMGNRSLQPAHPLLSAARARTWRCVDQLACRRRRLGRGPDRAEVAP